MYRNRFEQYRLPDLDIRGFQDRAYFTGSDNSRYLNSRGRIYQRVGNGAEGQPYGHSESEPFF